MDKQRAEELWEKWIGSMSPAEAEPILREDEATLTDGIEKHVHILNKKNHWGATDDEMDEAIDAIEYMIDLD